MREKGAKPFSQNFLIIHKSLFMNLFTSVDPWSNELQFNNYEFSSEAHVLVLEESGYHKASCEPRVIN